MPRLLPASLIRWCLLLTVLISSAAAGPERPVTSVATVLAGATGELAAAWQQVLAVGSSVECD